MSAVAERVAVLRGQALAMRDRWSQGEPERATAAAESVLKSADQAWAAGEYARALRLWEEAQALLDIAEPRIARRPGFLLTPER